MGTSGSYTGSGGKTGSDLRQGVDDWLGSLSGADQSTPVSSTPTDGDQQEPGPGIETVFLQTKTLHAVICLLVRCLTWWAFSDHDPEAVVTLTVLAAAEEVVVVEEVRARRRAIAAAPSAQQRVMRPRLGQQHQPPMPTGPVMLRVLLRSGSATKTCVHFALSRS